VCVTWAGIQLPVGHDDDWLSLSRLYLLSLSAMGTPSQLSGLM
jgi:hypothetical protein